MPDVPLIVPSVPPSLPAPVPGSIRMRMRVRMSAHSTAPGALELRQDTPYLPAPPGPRGRLSEISTPHLVDPPWRFDRAPPDVLCPEEVHADGDDPSLLGHALRGHSVPCGLGPLIIARNEIIGAWH